MSYQKLTDEMFTHITEALGVHVMALVVEHALWQTKQKYQEADLITFIDDKIQLEALDNLDSDRARLITQEFQMMVVATLSRLLGEQIARQLTGDLQEVSGVRE